MSKENKDKKNETEITETNLENVVETMIDRRDVRGTVAIAAAKKEKKTTLSEEEKKRFIHRKLNGINNKRMTGRLERTALNLYNLK